ALACVFDVRTRRIPNELTLGAAAAALGTHTFLSGISGVTASAAGWLGGVTLFFPLFALRGMGAGDVKLLRAMGAWLGPASAVQVAVYSALAGGLMAVVVALRAGYLTQALRNLKSLAKFWLTVGFKPLPELTLEHAQAPRLAYALPMLAGVLV